MNTQDYLDRTAEKTPSNHGYDGFAPHKVGKLVKEGKNPSPQVLLTNVTVTLEWMRRNNVGWSIGFDTAWQRDIGYGVIAYCDHPKCNETIDRGLAYVCGGHPYGGECGCGLYFCSKHLIIGFQGREYATQLCPKCARYDYKPYKPKPEHPEWIEWKMTDPSWAKWREENKLTTKQS